MKNKLLFAVAGVLVFALGGLFAWADAPGLLNYQGRISIGSNPFTGTGLFKFALVNQAGDQTYWSNDGSSVGGAEPVAAVSLPVSRGIYSVPLGDIFFAKHDSGDSCIGFYFEFRCAFAGLVQ